MEDFSTTITINYGSDASILSPTTTYEIEPDRITTLTYRTISNFINVTNLTNVESSTGSTAELQPLPYFSLPEQRLIIALCTITSVLSFLGNTIVIFVEIFGRRSARNLRKFLINLAISDIIYGVLSVPFKFVSFTDVSTCFPICICLFFLADILLSLMSNR